MGKDTLNSIIDWHVAQQGGIWLGAFGTPPKSSLHSDSRYAPAIHTQLNEKGVDYA